MGVMKRSLLILALFAAFCVQANASVTVEQTTDPEFVINSGYSEATAEEILIAKNRALGKPAEPLYDSSCSRFVRFWRNIQGYIDPAVSTDRRIHHDIHLSPSARAL